MNTTQIVKIAGALLASTWLTACASTIERLENVGQAPALRKVDNPQTRADYQPLTWPLPDPQPPTRQYANSLWQPGARTFFRDQRANRVGDILRVNIEIDEKAEMDNQTNRTRTSEEDVGAPAVFGLENKLGFLTPGKPNPNSLFNIDSTTAMQGQGQIRRKDKIETQLAALVTQVLPNGNLVIEGSQEMRVNFEIREVSVAGVVRPEDISSNNTIESTQIAQSRIVYGGRGQLTDVQQPRYGNQIIDILSPF